MKKLFLCVSTALLAMLAGCSEGIGGGDFLTNLSGNNKIYYTTTDGKKVVLNGNFDSILISHTYNNGKGCLTFDEKVTIIGDSAFDGCETLLSIDIPDSVTSIGTHAFLGCSSLASITIPDSVTSIGGMAFWHCSSLAEVYCKPTIPPTVSDSVFYNNAPELKIYVPRNSVDAYKSASYWSYYSSYIVGYDFE